jgi:hypothetical protein
VPPGSVLEVLAPLAYVAGEGLAVVVVAHQRKSPGAYGAAVRGSNALTGSVDVVIELERFGDVSEDSRVLRTVSRYASTPEELVAALTDDGYDARGDTTAARQDAEREQVLETLRLLDRELTARDLTEEIDGLNERAARRHCQRLVADGDARKVGAGKKGDPHRWIHSGSPDLLLPESNSEDS